MLLLRSLYILLVAGSAGAQDVREHTRLAGPKATAITESQAAALTLTLSAVSLRPIQTWVRTAGTIDKTGKILSASLSGLEATLVKVGQRVRAFPPSSKSSMYQAYITRVDAARRRRRRRGVADGLGAAECHALRHGDRRRTGTIPVRPERGDHRGGRPSTSCTCSSSPDSTSRRKIQTGIQGELFTQVLDGVKEEAQVVTFGSFFIDAEHKLKGTEQNPPSPAGTSPDDHPRH